MCIHINQCASSLMHKTLTINRFLYKEVIKIYNQISRDSNRTIKTYTMARHSKSCTLNSDPMYFNAIMPRCVIKIITTL